MTNILLKQVNLENIEYPTLLREIYDPPEKLFYKGRLPSTPFKFPLIKGEGQKPSLLAKGRKEERLKGLIAVVGSRQMSQRGKKYIEEIVPKLVARGLGIVSGLAYGVDAWAHEICLKMSGYTLAVLPTPLNKIYPKENKELAERIIKSGGCLMSEFEDGREIIRSDFLRRNRIVSGLCEGVLVIEADKRSGSIATANFALDQGREVWVCPANPGEPNSEGILGLIEDGAKIF